MGAIAAGIAAGLAAVGAGVGNGQVIGHARNGWTGSITYVHWGWFDRSLAYLSDRYCFPCYEQVIQDCKITFRKGGISRCLF